VVSSCSYTRTLPRVGYDGGVLLYIATTADAS
jgi:hypothetical protein